LACIALLLGATGAKAEAKASAIHGNIACAGGKSRVLTRQGRDEGPVLSPDGRTVAFVRVLVKQIPYETFSERSALWVADCRTHAVRVLVPSNFSLADASRNLGDPGDPHFSPDGRFIYFVTSAAPTDGAIHRVDVRTGNERFVVYGGSDLHIFRSGPYRGDILTRQHSCHEEGGCDYPFFVFTPEGRRAAQIPHSNGWDDQALARWLKANHSQVQ
jgi:hypothetical protein